MTESRLPERPAPAPLDRQGWAQNNERLYRRFEELKRDPSALTRLRHDPEGCAMLMSIARHADKDRDQATATTYLAITFPDEAAVQAFLFGRLFNARTGGWAAALHGFFANHGDDERAMQRFVAGIGDLSPGPIADLLGACFTASSICESPVASPPTGITKEAWIDWTSVARSMRLRFLTRPDLQALLFDIMRRDPDGPVEWTLEHLLKDLGRLQKQPRYIADPPDGVDPGYLAAENVARDLSAKLTQLHAKWPRIEDYLREFESVGQRRLPGWRRQYQMFDNDLEYRQSRIAGRMTKFPDANAVRHAFENMLFDYPPLYPKVRDECDYYKFEPRFWRLVAWGALTESRMLVDDAVAFAKLLVSFGPWDEEGRKSKEAIEAVVRAWPTEERVLVFLAEAEQREDVGAFIRDDMARLRCEAQAGKNIRMDRDWPVF